MDERERGASSATSLAMNSMTILTRCSERAGRYHHGCGTVTAASTLSIMRSSPTTTPQSSALRNWPTGIASGLTIAIEATANIICINLEARSAARQA